MKTNRKFLPLLSAALGIAALVLRLGLDLFGTDEKGLLISGHPLSATLLALTLAATALTVLSVLGLNGSDRYDHNFSPSAAAAIGAMALAGGILVSIVLSSTAGMPLDRLRCICGVPAVPALVWAGLRRWKGTRPPFFCHGAVCLYLTLHMVSHYQVWSSRPQLQDWFFSMTGILLLALFAYYQTAFDVDMGKRRPQLATGLLAAFFCLAALAGGEDVPLYLGGAVWALTNLCSLKPRRRKNPAPEGSTHEAA